MMNRTSLTLALVMLFGLLNAQSFFTRTSENNINLRFDDERTIIPEKYDVYRLDVESFKDYLHRAPMEFTQRNGLKLQVPMPDGTMESFEVFESPVMEPGISARYPSIKSYKAYSLDNKSTNMRFALSPQGFYAAIRTIDGEFYIDPYSEKNTKDYIVYDTKDFKSDIYKDIPMCGVEDAIRPEYSHHVSLVETRADNVTLRVFRLAMACTAEWGSRPRRGTVESCLADMNTMMTRMNSIYENDIACRFLIVDDNDKLIFLNINDQPYENTTEGKKILGNNTRIINQYLPGGASSYDIGHVLSICYDIGGVAQLGSLCQTNKGNGVTCNNTNDLSQIVTRVVAHEVGHQFNASHTWNRCPGIEDQRAGTVAYEPGSGTTIMSYAGSCGTDNVAGDNDDYFHVASLIQMYGKTNIGGNAYACSQKVNTSNHYPVVSVPTETYTIPITTPFYLKGSATDEDGDRLTYTWEQYDLGEDVPLGTITEDGPLYRSVKPTVDGDVRFIPKPTSLLSGLLNEKTEPLSDLARTLNFKLTVRDNNAEVGGIAWEDYVVKVTDKAGPFKLIFPEVDAQFKAGQLATITWDVANTDKAPVNCQTVNIFGSYLSAIRDEDPNLVPLAMGVPNNGYCNVVIPEETSNFFRIIIKAADNIFLTASKIPSKIQEPSEPELYVTASAGNLRICQPNTAVVTYDSKGIGGFDDDINYEIISDLPEGVTASLNSSSAAVGESVFVTINTENITADVSGELVVRVSANGINDRMIITEFTAESGDIDDVATLSPENGAQGIEGNIDFSWEGKPDAINYEIQIATNPDFSNEHLIGSAEREETSYRFNAVLEKATLYYWRVRANNNCRNGEWSEISVFSSEALACKEYKSGVQDIVIPTAKDTETEIEVFIGESGIISDLNITAIKAQHGRLSDISATLVSPSGVEARLWRKQCGNQQNVNVRIDDQAPDFFRCPINTGRLYRPQNGLDKLEVFNGEQMNGTWKLKVFDDVAGQGGRLQELNLEICANITVNPPVLVNNNTLELPPSDLVSIPTSLLEARKEGNNNPDELTFTIVSLPKHGTLIYLDAPAWVGLQFTQTDINNYWLAFHADNENYEGTDFFTFTVDDGKAGWIGITEFIIDIDKGHPSSSFDAIFANDIYVYPNPVSNEFNIVLSGKAIDFTQYRMSDVSGKTVKSGKLEDTSSKLNTEGIKPGVYFITLTNGKNIVSKKIVKI